VNQLRSLAAPAARWSLFVARRLGSAGIALLGVTILVFVVTHLLADPVYLLIGQRGTPAMINSMRHSLGYDQPLWVQYLRYLGALLHGDFGTSRFTFQPVAGEIAQRWPEARVAMAHRTGRLEIGEASVVVSVSCPHRAEAIDACRLGIDRLKESVPIWKKEHADDGTYWIEGDTAKRS